MLFGHFEHRTTGVVHKGYKLVCFLSEISDSWLWNNNIRWHKLPPPGIKCLSCHVSLLGMTVSSWALSQNKQNSHTSMWWLQAGIWALGRWARRINPSGKSISLGYITQKVPENSWLQCETISMNLKCENKITYSLKLLLLGILLQWQEMNSFSRCINSSDLICIIPNKEFLQKYQLVMDWEREKNTVKKTWKHWAR